MKTPGALVSLVLLWQGLSPISAHAADAKATTLLLQAVAAQGGEAKLRALKSVQWEAAGYRNELEQSERPEGPYVTEFLSIHEVHDIAGHRFLRAIDTSVYPVYKASTLLVTDGDLAMQANGGPSMPGTPEQLKLARERMALSPERLLLTALDATDVHTEPDVVLQSVPQNVVAFTLDGAPVQVFLNAYTHLPTALDYSGPLAHSSYWGFLGDVTQRTYFGEWWLAKGGIHLPMQINMEGDGKLDQVLVIRKLELDSPLKEADLTIPAEIRTQYRPDAKARDLDSVPLGNARESATELAPGLVFIPGSWNTTIVRQEDGIVILEAPISSGYSARVIAEARHRFPGLPVKAVITTSDSWPHLAGMRQYVAEGIPIYALDLNEPILQRVIENPRRSKPDSLSRNPRKPELHLVNGKVTLGTGANRLEIYPLRGETSERQMMVYFPEHHLLYGSDPFQQLPDGTYFYPQTVTELQDAVAREHLNVDRFFMMHIAPTPWTELDKAVQAAEKENSPTGIL